MSTQNVTLLHLSAHQQQMQFFFLFNGRGVAIVTLLFLLVKQPCCYFCTFPLLYQYPLISFLFLSHRIQASFTGEDNPLMSLLWKLSYSLTCIWVYVLGGLK